MHIFDPYFVFEASIDLMVLQLYLSVIRESSVPMFTADYEFSYLKKKTCVD